MEVSREADEILRAFEKHFVDTGLVPDSYRELVNACFGEVTWMA